MSPLPRRTYRRANSFLNFSDRRGTQAKPARNTRLFTSVSRHKTVRNARRAAVARLIARGSLPSVSVEHSSRTEVVTIGAHTGQLWKALVLPSASHNLAT